MSAPARPPQYGLLEPYLSPWEAAKATLAHLAVQAEIYPTWIGPAGVALTIAVAEHADERLILAIQGAAATTIRLVIDPSHWIRGDVELQSGAHHTFWLDHPYEEYEFWPNDSDGEDESPGRMGKRGHWIQVDAQAWPNLPAQPRWLQFDAMDS